MRSYGFIISQIIRYPLRPDHVSVSDRSIRPHAILFLSLSSCAFVRSLDLTTSVSV